MRKTRWVIIEGCCLSLLLALPVFALVGVFRDAKGDHALSADFIERYKSVKDEARESMSMEPLLKFRSECDRPEEIADLEIFIGKAYNHQGGFVDHEKSVIHLSNALSYALPEETYLKVLMWRGNSYELKRRHDDALKDYLRGLLACSYHDLSGGWPSVDRELIDANGPGVRTADGSGDPPQEYLDKHRDFRRFHDQLRLDENLLFMRYAFIEAIKRIRADQSLDSVKILNTLMEISPDRARYASLIQLIEGENEGRPLP